MTNSNDELLNELCSGLHHQVVITLGGVKHDERCLVAAALIEALEATIRQQAETIERLRNVLEQIHKKRDAHANWRLYPSNLLEWAYCADDMANLARAALEDKADE